MKYIAVVVILAFWNINAYSHSMEQKPLQHLMGKLNLTDEQKKEAEKIRFDTEKQAIAQRAKIATLRLEMRELLKADTPDKSSIEKKMNEISDQTVQLQMIRVNAWFAVNKMLNPDQQKQWKKVLEKGPVMMKKGNMNRFRIDRRDGEGASQEGMPHPDMPMVPMPR